MGCLPWDELLHHCTPFNFSVHLGWQLLCEEVNHDAVSIGVSSYSGVQQALLSAAASAMASPERRLQLHVNEMLIVACHPFRSGATMVRRKGWERKLSGA